MRTDRLYMGCEINPSDQEGVLQHPKHPPRSAPDIRWNGLASEMDYWNGEMLHRTYLFIQHVLYSKQ